MTRASPRSRDGLAASGGSAAGSRRRRAPAPPPRGGACPGGAARPPLAIGRRRRRAALRRHRQPPPSALVALHPERLAVLAAVPRPAAFASTHRRAPRRSMWPSSFLAHRLAAHRGLAALARRALVVDGGGGGCGGAFGVGQPVASAMPRSARSIASHASAAAGLRRRRRRRRRRCAARRQGAAAASSPRSRAPPAPLPHALSASPRAAAPATAATARRAAAARRRRQRRRVGLEPPRGDDLQPVAVTPAGTAASPAAATAVDGEQPQLVAFAQDDDWPCTIVDLAAALAAPPRACGRCRRHHLERAVGLCARRPCTRALQVRNPSSRDVVDVSRPKTIRV